MNIPVYAFRGLLFFVVLIDKDQKAQWKPSELQEVTTNDVAKYFAPLPDFKELTGLRTHVSRDAKKALT